MAEVHGARGQVIFVDPALPTISLDVIVNVRGFVLNLAHDLADVTKLQGDLLSPTPAPATGVLMHEYAGLHGGFAATVEGAINDDAADLPNLDNIISTSTGLLRLMDGDGNVYDGRAFCKNWRVENDRFDVSLITAEFQGDDAMTITNPP